MPVWVLTDLLVEQGTESLSCCCEYSTDQLLIHHERSMKTSSKESSHCWKKWIGLQSQGGQEKISGILSQQLLLAARTLTGGNSRNYVSVEMSSQVCPPWPVSQFKT